MAGGGSFAVGLGASASAFGGLTNFGGGGGTFTSGMGSDAVIGASILGVFDRIGSI
jgi:hypothetical protein